MKRSNASRVKRRSPGKFSARGIAKALLAQRAARKAAQKRKVAVQARSNFKPRKSDRGSIVFISTAGKRNPAKKGRRGYPVYVTKTGKKWLIRQSGAKPYASRTISELVLPSRANLRRATKDFQKKRLVRIGRTQTVVRRSGRISAGGAHDFNNKISDRIASSIRTALGAQASHRIFLIKFIALVQLPNGQTESIQGEVPIERPDHIAIRLAGIKNFVRQKFYSFMARELAFAGYVSNGSANHIRRLGANRGKPRDKWKDRRGEPWTGRNKTQVEILTIEWKIEQAT